MPAVIPFIANYAAGALFASEVVGLVASVASAVAVGNYQRRKAQRKARDAFNASLTDRTTMTALTQGARSRVYGRARNVDGVLFKGTRGADKRYYTLVVAVAGHEVDAIEDVYFNDQIVTLDGSGYVTAGPGTVAERLNGTATITTNGSGNGSVVLANTPVSGTVFGSYTIGEGVVNQETRTVTVSMAGTTASVSAGPVSTDVEVRYQYDQNHSYARVRKYLGTAAQDISAELTPNFPAVTSDDKFAGIALLLVDLEYSQDAFPTGVPHISAVVKGAKILDTRTSTTAWSANPAMIARDWALYANGGGAVSAQFDATACETAANACDVDSTFTTGASPVTMDTYQCGIVIPLDSSPTEAMDEIVESMAGRWGWAGGRLRLVAGSFRSAVGSTITEDWITDAADIEIVASPPRSELVNGYRATIANRDNAYIAEPMPELAPSAYVTSDGQKLLREVQFGGVTKREHALHIAGVFLRDARQGLTVKLPCNMRAWQVELFDVKAVTLSTFGWSAKTFEVMGWEYSLAGGVMLTLKETVASIYTVDAAFTGLENSDNTELPSPATVEQVTGLALANDTVTLQDGSSVARVRATWTLVTDINVLQSGWIELQYLRLGLDSSDDLYGKWLSQLVRGDQDGAYVTGLKPGGVYLFQARAINTLGVRGKWSDQKAIVVSAGAIGGGNLLPNASFEVDANADGTPDGWVGYSNGTTGTVSYSIVTGGLRGGKYLRVDATGLGTAAGDQAGAYDVVELNNLVGAPFIYSGYLYGLGAGTGSVDLRLYIDFYDGAGGTGSTTGSASIVLDRPLSSLNRYALTGTIPAATVSARCYTWMQARGTSSGACHFRADDMQFEIGNSLTAYAPKTDEILAGAVGTTQIASTAVTTPKLDTNARGLRRVATQASSVTVTETTHIPDGYTFKTALVSDSQFTAAYDGFAVVTFTGTVSLSASAGTTEWIVGNTDVSYNGNDLQQTGPNPIASTYQRSVSNTLMFALTASDTYTFEAYASKNAGGETVSFHTMQLLVEVTYTG